MTCVVDVCGIPKKGLPKAFKTACDACQKKDMLGFKKGPCEAKQCPKQRPNCSDGEQKKPFCAFKKGKAFEDVYNDRCCKGTNHDQVIEGFCPQF